MGDENTFKEAYLGPGQTDALFPVHGLCHFQDGFSQFIVYILDRPRLLTQRSVGISLGVVFKA
jgi:hypothetical protein